MKKTLYLFLSLFCLVLCTRRASAQTIASHFEMHDSTACGSTSFHVNVSGCTSGLTMIAWYGDGYTTPATPVYCSGTSGSATFYHIYSSPGSYTVKLVLYSGTTALDTSVFTLDQSYCTSIPIGNYLDMNSNCLYDAGDIYLSHACAIQVDSAGVHVDTLTSLAISYYAAYGPPGTVYQFRVLTPPAGLTPTCPSSGVINYTIPPAGTTIPLLYFGYVCGTSSSYDLSLNASVRAAVTGARTYGWVFNTSCSTTVATVKIDFSPKYAFASLSAPYPYTISGNSITINIGPVSAFQAMPYYVYFTPVGTLTMGDTVHSTQTVYPTTDADPSNNSVSRVDTIRASLDPNQKTVLPTGDIAAGAQLQYMLEFENTGNGIAHNIHIMDTLSDYLDINTIKVVSSSHPASLINYVSGGQNIVKFDFPNINLADSSHHDANKGMVVFSIKAKSTLAPGTVIPNRGGIYFDTNPVVMTNTAYSKIPVPAIGGVLPISGKEIALYPNPVKNTLSISAEPGTFTSLRITNALGQQVLSQDFNNNVNVSSLPSGLYYITLKGSTEIKTMQFEKL